MLHHIVMFRLFDPSPENAQALRDDYFARLSEVESIHHLTVEVQCVPAPTAFDIIQDTRFRTYEDFQAYLVDPRHREAGSILRAATHMIASGNYESAPMSREAKPLHAVLPAGSTVLGRP